jgi:hypothetical protein
MMLSVFRLLMAADVCSGQGLVEQVIGVIDCHCASRRREQRSILSSAAVAAFAE